MEFTTSTGITSISLTESVISLQEGNTSNILNCAILIHADADNCTGSSRNVGTRISGGIMKSCNSTCQRMFGL